MKENPHVARAWKPGQFVVLLTHEKGERVPMSIYCTDRETGRIGMFVRRHGKTTFELWNKFNVGDSPTPLQVPSGDR